MQELADSVHLSQSALSRLIGRLESEGLVTRAICPQDRRGIFACLTAEGRARYEAARPAQRRCWPTRSASARARPARVERGGRGRRRARSRAIGRGLLVLLGVRSG